MCNRRTFSFHGIGVEVASSDGELLTSVVHDFSYFEAPIDRPDLRIEVRPQKPDYDALPEITRSVSTPRNISFMGDGVVYIDYFGRALNRYRAKENDCLVTTDDQHMAREIVYLTILSRVSAQLERQGIHRVHALGLERAGKAIVLMLPSGGGKSTLALAALRQSDTGIRLIAEDSPLIRRDGWLLPFPIRIGVHPHRIPDGIDPRFLKFEKRMEFDPKVTIDVAYFADRLVREAVEPGLLLLGRRTTAREARIVPVPKRQVFRHALMNSIIGIGLYQGMEYICQNGLGDVAAHAALMLSRSYSTMNLVRRSQVYEFVIGRDRDQNLKTLLDFVQATR